MNPYAFYILELTAIGEHRTTLLPLHGKREFDYVTS